MSNKIKTIPIFHIESGILINIKYEMIKSQRYDEASYMRDQILKIYLN